MSYRTCCNYNSYSKSHVISIYSYNLIPDAINQTAVSRSPENAPLDWILPIFSFLGLLAHRLTVTSSVIFYHSFALFSWAYLGSSLFRSIRLSLPDTISQKWRASRGFQLCYSILFLPCIKLWHISNIFLFGKKLGHQDSFVANMFLQVLPL